MPAMVIKVTCATGPDACTVGRTGRGWIIAGPMQISVLLDRSRRESLTTSRRSDSRCDPLHARFGPGRGCRRRGDSRSNSRSPATPWCAPMKCDRSKACRIASGVGNLRRRELPGRRSSRQRRRGATPDPAPCRTCRCRRAVHVPTTRRLERNRLSFDFFPGRPSAALFPLKTWRRLLQSNLSHGGGAGLSQYGDPAGLPALRSAIANHLATTRGIAADPSRIIDCRRRAGMHQHRGAAFSQPRHAERRSRTPAIRERHTHSRRPAPKSSSVAIDFDGLIPEELPQRPTALLYLTPSHQFPTGATLSAGRRRAIVAWARRYGCYILEDDCDGDFRYEGSPSAGHRRAGARLHHLSRNLLAYARGRTAARLHGRARAIGRVPSRRQRLCSTRQSLARSGGARRDDAQRQLCGAPVARPLALQGKSRLPAGRAAAQFRRCQRKRRIRRPAHRLASAGRCSRCRQRSKIWPGARASASTHSLRRGAYVATPSR